MINLNFSTPNTTIINLNKTEYTHKSVYSGVKYESLLLKPSQVSNNNKIKLFFGRLLNRIGRTKQIQPLSSNELEKIFAYITKDCQNKEAKTWTNENLPKNQQEIQSIIKKSVLKRDTILYRGVKPGEINNNSHINFSETDGILIEDFIKMKEYKSPGFSSTTLSKKVATWFQLQNNLIFEIEAPKGTHCFDVGTHSKIFKKIAKSKGHNLLFLREKEVILPLETTYQIKGFKKLDKYLIACLKIIK